MSLLIILQLFLTFSHQYDSMFAMPVPSQKFMPLSFRTKHSLLKICLPENCFNVIKKCQVDKMFFKKIFVKNLTILKCFTCKAES
jgi:hypothetical protein